MEADASRYHSVKPEEADWSASERQTRAVAEFLGALKSKAGPAERHPGVLWKPQRFVQVRIVKNVPEMIDDLAISPKLIRKHKLDRSQHDCEKCVVAVQQHGFYRRRTDEIAESRDGRGIRKIARRRYVLPQQILPRPYRTFDYAIRLHGKAVRDALVSRLVRIVEQST